MLVHSYIRFKKVSVLPALQRFKYNKFYIFIDLKAYSYFLMTDLSHHGGPQVQRKTKSVSLGLVLNVVFLSPFRSKVGELKYPPSARLYIL